MKSNTSFMFENSYKLMKNDDDVIGSYNKFMMEQMHYLETTIETIQTLMEYHSYTIETIMGQLDEMKDLIIKIEKEQTKQQLEREERELQEQNEEQNSQRNDESESRSLSRRDSFTTVTTAINDDSVSVIHTIKDNNNGGDDTSSEKIVIDSLENNNNAEPEAETKQTSSTSLFDEIYNAEEVNSMIEDDDNTEFLRICKTVDFLIQDAYTAISYIPTSSLPLTSSMAFYTTKYKI